VRRNAEQPSRKRRLFAKAFKVLQRAQERLLRHVLGVLFVPHDPARERINRAFVPLYQRFERLQFARLRPPHEFAVAEIKHCLDHAEKLFS
jgi:hypothetical protein